ncbi:MAG TPA: ATP-binding protein [Nanoarchaeota archaeon]|nr:ATP-binding protein [Nanoarchaeota archaeon]
MKYENEKDKSLLQDWDLKPKNLPVKIFVPFGHYSNFIDNGIPVDESFALDPTELDPEDWIITFGLNLINPVSVLIERTLINLKENKKNFTIKNILEDLEKDKRSEKETINAAVGLFEAAETWGIFAREKMKPTKTKDLIKGGITSILDLSAYNSIGAFNVRALVISLLSRKIFQERMNSRRIEEVRSISRGLDYSSFTEKKEYPLVWLFIDEAHEFLPKDEKIISTDALIQILREGRQPGISIVLATQQPGKIHTDVMTQADIVLAHRVTSKPDIEALNNMMQSYLTDTIQGYMNDLPGLKGSAIILDDNSERIYPMRMRPRFTWHGGEAPSALYEKKDL